MNVYIVSWGVGDGENYIETESVVLPALEDARDEFAALDPAVAATGAVADEALKRGWHACAQLVEVEMLDDKNQPTNSIDAWVYEGARTVLEEK